MRECIYDRNKIRPLILKSHINYRNDHLGIKSMESEIDSTYEIPKIRTQLKEVLKSCSICNTKTKKYYKSFNNFRSTRHNDVSVRKINILDTDEN